MPDLTVTQVVPQITQVTAASVNTPNNEQVAAFNQHQYGTSYRHTTDDIDVPVLLDNITPVTTTTDLYTMLNRIASALKKAINPDAASWAAAVSGLATTENVHDNYVLLLSHSHTDATNGGKLLQANTHQIPDTDLAPTSIHHTLGSTANTAAAGNHTHAIYELGANKNAASGYAGLTAGLIADNQISTNIARVTDLNTGLGTRDTAISLRSLIGHQHGVTSGEVAITSSGLAADSVITVKILDKNVTNAKIGDAAVDSRTLADNAIISRTIASNAVINVKLADDSVDARVIAPATITSAELANDSVGTNQLANGAVTAAKFDPAGLNGSAITDNTMSGTKILDYSIPFTKMSAGAIYPTTPRSGSVNINGLRKWNMNRQSVDYAGEIFDLVPSLPGPGNKRYVLLELNSTGHVYANLGLPTTGTPVRPDKTADTTGLGFVYLEYGMPYVDTGNIYPWLGPDDGGTGGTGAGVGHVHGESNQSLVSSIGLAEGMAQFTLTPSFYINIVGMHYRHTSGQVRYYSGGQIGPFARPVADRRIDAVYLDTGTGLPVIVQGVTHPTTPVAPAFSGDQRSICYVNLRSASTYIGPADDGVNGWITDARQWVAGGGGPTSINSVATGGTGSASFTAGLVYSGGGTTALTSVAAPTGAVVGTTDSQILSRKTFTNYDPNTIGTIFKHIAGTTVDLVQYQDSAGVAFGNVSRYNTFGFGASEITGATRFLIGGVTNGTATAKAATQLVIGGISQAFDNTAASAAINAITNQRANGIIGASGYGVMSNIARAGGDTGSFISAAAYIGVAPTFAANNYLMVGSGDIGITGVTAFPPNPSANQTCYRSDHRCWYSYDSTNTAWRQNGIPQFLTAQRPANPGVTDFRYFDLNTRFTMKWDNISTYKRVETTFLGVDSSIAYPASIAAMTWNGTVINAGVSTLFQTAGWNGTVSFTVEDSSSILSFTAAGCVLVTNASGTIAQPIIFVQINGVNYTVASQYYPTGTTNYMRGTFHRNLTLPAGNYSIIMSYLCDQNTTVFCQPNIDSFRYQCLMQMVEHKP